MNPTLEQINAIMQAQKGTSNYDDAKESNYRGRGNAPIVPVPKSLDYQFKIVNGSSADVNIAISTAFYPVLGVVLAGSPLAASVHYHDKTAINNAGHSDVDAVLDDGTIATSVVCTGLRQKIRDFMEFTRQNPCIVPEIQIESDDKAQWNQELTIRQVSPFRKAGDVDNIILSKYYRETNLNTNKITLPLLSEGRILQFDDQTLMILGVGAGRTITVTLSVGLIENAAANYNKVIKQAVLGQ